MKLKESKTKRIKLPAGLNIREIIYSRHGRKMKVTDIYRNGLIGVVSMDKEKRTAVWPREWCIKQGDQIPLFKN